MRFGTTTDSERSHSVAAARDAKGDGRTGGAYRRAAQAGDDGPLRDDRSVSLIKLTFTLGIAAEGDARSRRVIGDQAPRSD